MTLNRCIATFEFLFNEAPLSILAPAKNLVDNDKPKPTRNFPIENLQESKPWFSPLHTNDESSIHSYLLQCKFSNANKTDHTQVCQLHLSRSAPYQLCGICPFLNFWLRV